MVNHEYTIGIICALPVELAAVRAMLNEVHGNGRPQVIHAMDQNSYILGRIGEHNVVVAGLPAGIYGTTPAATVAAHMLASFGAIRFGMLVGVGGGIPSTEHDIRLGDVVVSTPGPAAGAVIQYDLGKLLQGRSLVRTGSLNKPPPVILNAMNRLRAEHLLGGNNILVQLSRLGDGKTNAKALFGKPGPENDRLFEAEYAHPMDANTCDLCDTARLMKRMVREQDTPVIHYGSIASGNRVMKDAIERDKLREQHEVLCFEMEAAGLMDNFPCLVVRGICDYADSHKNKMWQGHAAFTAAAYMKELLDMLPAKDTQPLPAIPARTITKDSVFYYFLGYVTSRLVLPDGNVYSTPSSRDRVGGHGIPSQWWEGGDDSDGGGFGGFGGFGSDGGDGGGD
jgi:nucleoside phosphorylase